MIAPMLCHAKATTLADVPLSTAWVMEPKLDGWRWQIETTDNEVLAYSGRNGRRHQCPPPVQEALTWLPSGTILDGELVPVEMGLKAPVVSTLLALGGDNLVFVAFDLLQLAGHSLVDRPWDKRRAGLDRLLWEGFITRDLGVVLTPVSPVDPTSPLLLAQYLEQGFEGCVVKRKDSLYRPGKRSPDWRKVKPQETAEALVTGWVLGRGQSNAHRVGALIIDLEGIVTSCAYSSTVHEAEQLIGRMIEIKHHGIMESGKPRHPIFSRTREDLE